MRIITKAKRYHKAAREGNCKILREANRWEVNDVDGSGLSPLLWAAGEGHVEAVRVLLNRKAKVCAVDGFGNSALHLAAGRGHLECVKVLVTKGANLYALDGGQRTACDLAKIGDWDEVVEFLERVVKILESRNPKRVQKLKKLAQERYDKIKDVVQEDGTVLKRQESNEFGEREGVGRTEDLLLSGEEDSSDAKSPDEPDVQQEQPNLVGLLVHKSSGLTASTSKSTARSYLVFSELIKEQSINQTIVNSLETRPQRAELPPSPLPEEENSVESTLRAFLELYDLQRIHRQLQDKGLDLNRLMTMTEHDIKALLGLPLGPHRKLCVALEEYKSTQKWDGP